MKKLLYCASFLAISAFYFFLCFLFPDQAQVIWGACAGWMVGTGVVWFLDRVFDY